MSPRKGEKREPYHVVHKVPAGDTPYVRAKHVQLVDKDPDAAIVLFWKAINAGDRVDTALKDMAVVMKQQDRAEEAIEAIRSFRGRCSKQAQESLDNVLIDLYKKCGRLDEQIELLKRKLRMIYQGEVFNGKATKTARSRGKKFQVSVKQETSRTLGNLGWAYMQQRNYQAAEAVYRKAQTIDPDANKACNLTLCLIRQGQFDEALKALDDVFLCLIRQGQFDEALKALDDVFQGKLAGSDDPKSRSRAKELLREIESLRPPIVSLPEKLDIDEPIIQRLDMIMNEWTPFRSRRLPIFEEISPFRDQIAC